MSSEEIRIRKFKEGDESQILDLFNSVFSENRSISHWKWQWMKGTHGPGYISVAEFDNQIIGHLGCVHNKLNFNGHSLDLGLACDSMVKAGFQGKGFFTNLASQNIDGMIEDGVKAIIGFVSRENFPSIYPLWIQRIGWLRIANLKRYYLRIGLNRILKKSGDRLFKHGYSSFFKLKKKINMLQLGKKFEVEVTSQIPDDLEKTLKHIRTFEVLSIWKDLPYLKWRYEKHPEYKYIFYVLRVNGIASALIVTRDRGYSIAICDVFHARKDILETVVLLLEVLKHFSLKRAQLIEFYGYDNGFYDSVFSMAGFTIHNFSSHIFMGKTFGDEKLDTFFRIPQNWSIAYGDTDYV